MLSLIQSWLDMPVEETDERGHKRRTTRNRDEGQGTPQGAVISPLLANLYMRRFVLGWETLGHGSRLDAKLVNYADDFVICCRGKGADAMASMRTMMAKLKLTVNEKKTRLCRLPEETFDFLGYTIGRCYSPQTGRCYLGTYPSDKKVRKMVATIRTLTARKTTGRDPEELVGQLNRKIVGWANYFRLGPVSSAYDIVNRHVCQRLRRWLCRKYRVVGAGLKRFSDSYLRATLGLVDLRQHRHKLLCANA